MLTKALLLSLLAFAVGCGTKADLETEKKFSEFVEKDTSANEALYNAIEASETVLARSAILNGASLNHFFPNGETPLTMALKKGKPSLVKAILDGRPNPDLPNRKGETPIHLAVELKNRSSIFYLIEARANLDVLNARGQPPLMTALEQEDLGASLQLIKAGADTLKDSELALALAQRASLAPVERLINDVNNYRRGESLKLNELFAQGSLHFIEYLLKQASLKEKANGQNLLATAFHIEEPVKRNKILLLLLRSGLNPDGEAQDTIRPLFEAVKKDQVSAANALLEFGANPNVLNEAGLSPLALAASNLQADMAKKLYEFGSRKIYTYMDGELEKEINVCDAMPVGGMFFNRLSGEQKREKAKISSLLQCY